MPIVFTSDAASPQPGDWDGISLGGTSNAVFENVTIEYAGRVGPTIHSDAPLRLANCVIAHGASSGIRTSSDLTMSNCAVHHHAGDAMTLSGATGVVNVRDAAVHDNGGTGAVVGTTLARFERVSFDRNALPLLMNPNTDLAPSNTFDGNTLNEIQVAGAPTGVFSDRTWTRFADASSGAVVPYHVLNTAAAEGRFRIRATLTIEPGNVVQVALGLSLFSDGALRAVGTADAPILFTSDQEVKAPGHWNGLELVSARGMAVLENVTIEATGNGDSMSRVFTEARAAINSFRSAAVLKNCELRGNKVGLEIISDDAPVRVEGCTLRGHDVAVGAFPNSNLILRGNRIVDNGVGIAIHGCCGNLVHADNNVFDNAVNAVDRTGVSWFMPKTPAPAGNILGNPFFGGNAWSDYEGVDCTGDGLGDTLLPYRTQGGGVDFHPLVEVGLDTVPPVSTHALAGTAGKNGWWRSAARVTLDASDDWCGVAGIFYAVDGGARQAYTGPFRVTGDRRHTVTYWAEDRAGNVEPPHVVEIAIDTTPPTVRIRDPVRGNVYVNDVGVPLVVREACAPTPLAPPCEQVPFADLAKECPEVLPREVCAELPFDGLFPVTVLIGTKTLRADADDATSGVALVTFRTESRTIGADADAPYDTPWDTTRDSLARHTLVAVAEDAAGNVAESEPERPITVPLDAGLLLEGALDLVAGVDARAWCLGLAALVHAPEAACVAPPPASLAALPARASLAPVGPSPTEVERAPTSGPAR